MKALYFHPLFDEHKCSYRFSYCLSEALKLNGISLERSDYNGTGDSLHRFCDITLDTLRNDMDSLITGSVDILIGLRFGASLIYDYISRNKLTDCRVILIEPIFTGSQYIDYLLRKQRLKDLLTKIPQGYLQEDDYVNLAGYKTGKIFVSQLESFSMNIDNFIDGCRVYFIFTQRQSFGSKDGLVSKIESSKTINAEHVPLPDIWERIPVMDYTPLIERIVDCCHDR